MDPRVTFVENGPVDADQLNALYRLIGWDRDSRRTRAEIERMLEVSHYDTAVDAGSQLVGFARVCGDPYVVQLLDVIRHPDYRRMGVATRRLQGVAVHVEGARSDVALSMLFGSPSSLRARPRVGLGGVSSGEPRARV